MVGLSGILVGDAYSHDHPTNRGTDGGRTNDQDVSKCRDDGSKKLDFTMRKVFIHVWFKGNRNARADQRKINCDTHQTVTGSFVTGG